MTREKDNDMPMQRCAIVMADPGITEPEDAAESGTDESDPDAATEPSSAHEGAASRPARKTRSAGEGESQ